MFESFEHYWKIRKPDLDEALRKQIHRLLRDVPRSKSVELCMALNGGKKLRGVLLGMVTEDLGGEWELALPRAVAVELIQAATLIHDDFVDQDRMRRNMPAVWTLEGARKAVLMGDVIFASAIEMMSETGRDDGLVVSHVIAQISRGALMEPSEPLSLMRQMASKDWSSDHYKKIIHLKTGVLFGATCELGAISAEANEFIRLRCKRYGSFIGAAYQIADDITEIKRHLLHGQISPHQMAVLAPAILCFSKEASELLPPILNGRSVEIVQPFRECLRSAAARMEMEIQRLLAQALGEIQAVLREKKNTSLTLKAPEELIAMFNVSEFPVSAGGSSLNP